ncbi:hypothetical protein K7711_11485 [Nocardia sp. CA2R105]|uniref:hypothetical protein n=1 Tax=Nocardia coffeae TaxID=2873381 RepID=UPI001CA6C4A8|nr:hypothetical protein [Nocardia coffeae]MBY8857101.1 hypothetical protein [Nocardia coffeae]
MKLPDSPPRPRTAGICSEELLRITMVTVQVNGNETAWVCENRFGTGDDVLMVHSIETFAWDFDGNLLIKTYYPMPEHIGADADPYAHILRQGPDGNR